MRKIAVIFLVLSIVLQIQTQQVGCIKWTTTFVKPISCQSTSTRIRPINTTAQVQVLQNKDWSGDWQQHILRGNSLILNLFKQKYCYSYSPQRSFWQTGDTYQFGITCTNLSIQLQEGDVIFFILFSRGTFGNMTKFAIPIPGYSSQQPKQISKMMENIEHSEFKLSRDQ